MGIGEVLWHSIDESGHIAVYDVEWPDGTIETDIPAMLLEKVLDSDDEVEEAQHTHHGIAGHRLNSSISERKYKKKGKKKKARKSKRNKQKLYPYFYGIYDRGNDNYYEPSLDGGLEGGFDGGGE